MEHVDLQPDAASMRSALDARYRLPVDRRFVAALGDVDSILGGRAGSVGCSFAADHWDVRDDGTLVGTLPELPSFNDLFQLLQASVARVRSTHPDALTSSGPGTDARQLADLENDISRSWWNPPLAAVRRLDAEWASGSRDSRLLSLGAEALARLSDQMLDDTGAGEALQARALAITAIARSTGRDTRRAEVLLADSLGYGGDALALADGLPAADPLRAFLRRADPVLENAAMASGASDEAQYLWLRRLAETGNRGAFGRLVARVPTGTTSIAELDRLGGFDVQQTAPLSLEASALRDLLALDGAVPSTLAKQIEASYRSRSHLDLVDATITAHAAASTSLSGDAIGSYSRAMICTGIVRQFSFLLDDLGTPEDAAAFVSALGSTRGGQSAELVRAMDVEIGVATRKADASQVLDVMRDLNGLSGTIPDRLDDAFDRALGGNGSADVGVLSKRSELHVLAADLDTRPDLRLRFSWEVGAKLADLSLRDRLLASGAKSCPRCNPAEVATLASLDGDAGGVRHVLEDPSVSSRDLLATIDALGGASIVSGGDIRHAFERAIRLDPMQLEPYRKYAVWLSDAGDHQAAAKAMRSYLAAYKAAKRSPPGLDGLTANETIAKQLYLAGDVKGAYALLRPQVDSQKLSSMAWTATFAAVLGYDSEASNLLAAVDQRYPNRIESLCARLRTDWAAGKDAQAAGDLQNASIPVAGREWQDIGEAFWAARPARGATGLEAAVRALLSSGMDDSNIRDIITWRDNTDVATASQLYAVLLATRKRVDGHYQLMAFGHYDMLLRGGSEPDARKAFWNDLKSYDGTLSEQLTGYGYPTDCPIVVDAGGRIAANVMNWTLRVSCLLGLHKTPPPAELVDHFKQSDTHYDHYGRFLLGLEPAVEMRKQGVDDETKTEVAYFLGRKAELDGHVADAATWYRAALELSPDPREMESRYAWIRLMAWYPESLARLQRERAIASK